LAFLRLINASKNLVKEKRSQISYGEFMEGLHISDEAKHNFIKPLLAGIWGVPHRRADDFSMYPLMKYIYYHKPTGLSYFKLKTMHGGTEKYIKTISDLLTHTETRLRDGVVSIQPDEQNGKVSVKTESGQSFEFDKLLITAGAEDSQRMLAHSPLLRPLHDALSYFETYKAIVATHSDISYMPPSRKDWSLVNVTNDGDNSHSTIWHGMNTNTDLFCSYIDEGDIPKDLHYISEWRLPVETPAFFRAQQNIKPMQGRHNIWLCGAYTQDIGSHESAIVAAMKAVESISPDSPRLKTLKEV
jgi:predicted NAD/FAD-binding protein